MHTTRPARAVAVAALAAALATGIAAPAGAATVASSSTVEAAATTAPSYDQWLADVTTVTDQAQTYLASALAQVPSGEQPAIVLDIDNTALESYYKGGYPTPATPQVLALAKYAHAHGAKVFFISARPELINAATSYNLDEVGYPVDGLYSRDLYWLTQPIQDFKTMVRKNLTSDGYTIVANIGNNSTDLNGGYAQAVFKLPDYNGLLD
ncbi:HAD family acid phosphatase [Streptomyces sp. CoH27]|uniref:HAD family acid phosphatase n=1 Tax=Streptomyces sp. CoH27 TaxID=2875763 RepID=UPI001CD2868A|nr:HAD family acid phosphatase [Streptomyces sp. CoH27]